MRNFWQRMERMLICTILSRTLSEKILKMAKEALQNLCGNTLSGAFHRKRICFLRKTHRKSAGSSSLQLSHILEIRRNYGTGV